MTATSMCVLQIAPTHVLRDYRPYLGSVVIQYLYCLAYLLRSSKISYNTSMCLLLWNVAWSVCGYKSAATLTLSLSTVPRSLTKCCTG
jgi:hypothetical protein